MMFESKVLRVVDADEGRKLTYMRQNLAEHYAEGWRLVSAVSVGTHSNILDLFLERMVDKHGRDVVGG